MTSIIATAEHDLELNSPFGGGGAGGYYRKA